MNKISKSNFLKKIPAAEYIRGYFVILTLLIFLGFGCYRMVHSLLLEHAHKQGQILAQSYATEMQNSLNTFFTLLSFGTRTIDHCKEEGWSEEELEAWIQSYIQSSQHVLGQTSDPYVILNGRDLSPWHQEAGTSYDPTQSAWYQMAQNADSQFIYSDIYMDAVQYIPVLTLAQKCRTIDAVVAFDLFPGQFQIHSSDPVLPRGGSLFICDNNGALIDKHTSLTAAPEDLTQYVADLAREIREGRYKASDSWILDLNGEKRKIYYSILPDGWMTIITIPYTTIFAGLDQVMMVSLFFVLLFLAAFLWISIRETQLNSRMKRTKETVQALSNSYYAIYRVNPEEGTYEAIKGSDYIRSKLPKAGKYSLLLDTFEDIIAADAYEDFVRTFSPENILRLVSRHVRDFGGDFQRRFDDVYRWVNVRVLFDESLGNDDVVLCFRDIETEKIQQLQKQDLLENALENARRSEESKQRFFSSMSHDMRTPLNAVLGLADLIDKHLDQPDRVRDYVAKIRYSGGQLLALVNDILEMSRLEQGKLSLDHQQFNLPSCIHECADIFQAQATLEKKNFQVMISVQNNEVIGDTFRVGQILTNLLSNAFKFTEAGDTISLQVEQMNSNSQAQYMIRVMDTGLGMSEEFLSQVFEPYARENRFVSRQISGTGLGMPIVKTLIAQMDGSISIESAPGKGTTVTVLIPFAAAPENAPSVPQTGASRQDGFTLNGRHILLVEDNAINMEIAQEIFAMEEVHITEAWNGQEAVELFRQSELYQFDAILMDMQMPVMNGCQAASAIRALDRPDAADIPIIAVTANAFTEDIAAAMDAGMNAHVAKPIDFNVLAKTLEKLLSSSSDK